ncbi:hypothetical protein HPB47_014717 [Ixodes persulcatus]|uniref:Uncharacterized protein n=1 Tax=Ixodes persulcatus TaxID=34615 RepID=A0AC60QX63_IXOPE|nr:hypothetical protein HPB47_014717 [Ixodes persulcatus]
MPSTVMSSEPSDLSMPKHSSSWPRQVGDSPGQIVTRFRSVETRKKVAEGSILNSPSGTRETSNGRWYNRWPEEASSCIRLPGHGVQNAYPESTTKTSKYESDGSFRTRSTPTTKIDTDSTTSRPL